MTAYIINEPMREDVVGQLVISLDFELFWGVHDSRNLADYGCHIDNVRQIIPRILDLFMRYDIHATWATVGAIMARNVEEFLHYAPKLSERPGYANRTYSPYHLLEGSTLEKHPNLFFSPELVDLAASAPNQEIATHTFSHIYGLETGVTQSEFSADLKAWQRIAAARKIQSRSIVFPRNQYSDALLQVCASQGLNVYRGQPRSWMYRSANAAGQTLPRRVGRLVDSYTGFLSQERSQPKIHASTGMANVPASHFFRTPITREGPLRNQTVRVIKSLLRQTAARGQSFHMWWHPHNFSNDLEGSLKVLEEILVLAKSLINDGKLISQSMGESAGTVLRGPH